MSDSWALLSVVDAIAALVTPPAGFTLNAAGALPQEYWPDTIYAAPVSQSAAVVDTGSTDQANFRVRFAFSVSSSGEDGGKLRLRSVSDAEDAGVLLIAEAIRTNRQSSGLWDWLAVAQVTYDAVAQQDCRVAFVDVTGYRLVPA